MSFEALDKAKAAQGRTNVILVNEDGSFFKEIDVATEMLSVCCLISYNNMNFMYRGLQLGKLKFGRVGPILVVED